MRKHVLLLFGLLFLCNVPHLAQAAEDTLPFWLLKIKLNADFRYRHELISTQTYATPDNLQNSDRNRHRIRLRLGINYEVNSDMDIVTRFATSTASGTAGDPVSTNQDLTGASAPKPFWVDRAYADYHPLTGLALRAGRFAMPYEGTDLVWDSDLNLEGLAVSGLSKEFGGSWELLGRAGGYWLQERSIGADQGLLGGQGGIHYTDQTVSGQVAAGYYDFTNLKNAPVLVGAFGNTTLPGSTYAVDYDLLNINGQLKYVQPKWEGVLTGDFVTNLAADSNETGFYAGIMLKWKQFPIDWDFSYNYRDIQADAAVGALNDSDTRGGGTNVAGHKLSLFVTVAKNTRLGGNYLIDVVDPDGTKLDYNRLQFDLEAKF